MPRKKKEEAEKEEKKNEEKSKDSEKPERKSSLSSEQKETSERKKLQESEGGTSDIKKVSRDKKEAKKEERHDKEDDKKDETILTSLDDYIKTASYLGTKVITPSMRKYIYRRRLDGLAILNTNIVDKKLKEAIDFIVQFKPDEWVIACKRNSGWRAAKMFSELTGVRVFTKKYPAGILTNTELPDFFETKMILVCDSWIDRNALADAKKINIPVVGICDTNNHTSDIDVVIIANNKSNKSLGLIFWLLSREYMKVHKIDRKLPSLEEFVGEDLVLEEPKKKKKKKTGKTDEELIEERMKQLGAGAEEGV